MKARSILTICLTSISLCGGQAQAQSDHGSAQKIVCNIGYTVPECLGQVHALQEALKPYHPERLGSWTWVIVKSEDWKNIVRPRGLNPDTPAFTYLDKRETFLEEALFVPVANRSAELLLKWALPVDQLLDLAVRHELGHALCHAKDENVADTYARLLKEDAYAQCLAPNKQTRRQSLR